MGFYAYGNSYGQNLGYEQELQDVVAYFNSDEYLSAPAVWDGTTNTTTTLGEPSEAFVHYFSTKGISKYFFSLSFDASLVSPSRLTRLLQCSTMTSVHSGTRQTSEPSR